jgi:pimeloyl-ACP methyl ester carboxylesterase
MLRHREPRPWLICVHGTEMGRAGVDLTLFRAWHLHQQFGLNVMLPVLPQHGPRGRGLPKGKAFTREEILDNMHFAAQAVSDIRQLLGWIRNQQPGARIGLNGVSMGGYVAALVASLDDELTCAILGVPVADLVDVLGRHAGFRRGDPRRDTMRLAEPLSRMISPLSMKPQVPMSGRFIYGGVADRVVHPRDQVVRLWEHWGTPEIVWYSGGHAGFFTARPVQKFIDAAIVQSGLVDRG